LFRKAAIHTNEIFFPPPHYIVLEQTFERIRFACKQCHAPSIILSVAINLTYVILEGFCVQCRRGVHTTVDLLKVDQYINREETEVPVGPSKGYVPRSEFSA
jgi:hypothetical protein